jgi:hypothetical protein
MKFKAIAALAVLLALGSTAAWHWWPRLAPAPAPPPPVVAPPAPEAEPPTPIANPMPAASDAAAAPALPTLAESDQPFRALLLQLNGAQAAAALLVPENLIRHLVATVDNLPRHRLSVEVRPLRATAGSFKVTGDELNATLDDDNANRYQLAAALLRQIDMGAVAHLYQSYYPLFQRAYEDLGYPQGYFNDRLVAVIDHLLATPQLSGPVQLVRPKVFWEYADPELEARSAGQKLLLRIGSANAALVREKLRALRAQIAASAPADAPSAAPAKAPR